MHTAYPRVKANLAALEARIAAACGRAGRRRDEVTLVAVTKSVAPDVVAILPELGVVDLGESRPQELWRLSAMLPAVRWHLIGHLQRNKIERTVPLAYRLHSIDSERLLSALEADGRPVVGFLEVNCSGEAAKQGFASDDVVKLLPKIESLRHVSIVGLMTMAAFAEDPEQCRPAFACLHQLRDQLRGRAGERHSLAELSMGMSNDFEVAIEEGATTIRVGSALFEGVEGER